MEMPCVHCEVRNDAHAFVINSFAIKIANGQQMRTSDMSFLPFDHATCSGGLHLHKTHTVLTSFLLLSVRQDLTGQITHFVRMTRLYQTLNCTHTYTVPTDQNLSIFWIPSSYVVKFNTDFGDWRLIEHDTIVLTIFVTANHGAPHCVIFFIFISPPLSYVQIFSSATYF